MNSKEKILAQSKKKLLSKYPNIEKIGLFVEAIEIMRKKNPKILMNPRGPLIVMKKMEQLAKERNIDLKEA